MNDTAAILRCRSVRSALLASTGLAALAQLPAAAFAQTTVEETAVELTRRSDTVTLVDVTLDAAESTNLLGLTLNLIATGVDGDNGNDSITLGGVSIVSGSVDKSNDFGLLNALADLIAFFPAVNSTNVDVYGVEGGFGANTLRLQGDLQVAAQANAVQQNIDLSLTSEAVDLLPLTLTSGVRATAIGLNSTLGRSATTNEGDLLVEAVAEFARSDFAVDLAGVDLSSSFITADAVSIGLSGDRYTDVLTNGAEGVVTADATSRASVAGISLQRTSIVGADDAAQATAMSAAMAGGQGNDILVNDGALTAQATSELSETDISLAVKQLSPPEDLLPLSEPKSLSLAAATGMEGGLGADSMTNNGAIALTAFADFNQVGVAISDGGIDAGAVVTVIDSFSGEGGEESFGEGAIAEIVGLRGDERGASTGGADMLVNAGSITGTATADSDVVSLDIGLPFSEVYNGGGAGGSGGLTPAEKLLDSFGVGLLDYSSDSSAFADGVRGGAGNDTVINSGVIDVTANAMSGSVGVSVSALDVAPDNSSPDAAPDESVSINATVVNTSSSSLARAAGLAGGAEDDLIDNTASVVARADAEAFSTEVAVALAIEEKALQIETPVVFSRTEAAAFADGVDAGEGFDTVKNSGSLTSIADASATSTDVTVGLSLINTGGGVNAAVIDKDIIASATAAGIRDGLGTDTVENSGTINATATSNASSTSVGVDVTVNTATGLSVASGLAKADQKAASRAIGVERILDDRDADASFTSTGEIDATATATSVRAAVSVDLAYTNTGLSVAAPLLSVENIAEAYAGALVSFEGDDVFVGLADMSATAAANAASTSVGVSGAVSQIGVAAGVSALKASTTADADATLLSFGAGADTVSNASTLLADADAVSRSNGVSVAAGGANKGLAIGAALIDSATNAFAAATTIATGADADIVTNDADALAVSGPAEIKANALADASSTDVGVSIAALVGTPVNPGAGVGIGAALTRSSVLGDAEAIAVDLGAGGDRFENADIVGADATGKARTEAVNVALSGSMVGAAISGALGDTSVTANATATGAEGGADADTLKNTGVITGNAVADANTVGVGVSGSVAAGFAAGAAGVLADTNANAAALGMNGGEGQDNLENAGVITIESNADAANTSVAVNINVTPAGVSAGAAIVSARTLAYSDAVGLAGDEDGLDEDDETTVDPSEDDIIRNAAGVLTVKSRAEASSVSVGVNGQYNGFGGVALISDTIADAYAAGIFGGSGGDLLVNDASIVASSTALGSGPAVAVNPIGANIGDINTSASAFSFGMDGGVGADSLLNTGSISSTAASTVSGELVQVTLLGGVVGDLSTKANATAFGLNGGGGDDTLVSTGSLTNKATATQNGTSVAVNFAGASFADATSQANATAAGLAGGGGDNAFLIGGALNSSATANARSTNISVTLAGAAFADSADAATKATANSYGYLGGQDADAGEIGGAATIASAATARNDGAAATVAGASFTNLGPEANAFASVFSGGAGADIAVYSGSGPVTANADTTAGATSVSLIGASSAKANPKSLATARGLSGDAGDDALTNTGVLTATADADLSVARYRVSLAGASIGSISSSSIADAAGIDGGADSDVLRNNNTINSTAKSKLTSGGVDVTLFGANVDTADGDLTASSVAAGVRGGAGGDDIANFGGVTSNAQVTGQSGQVGIVLAGAGLVDARSTLEASAVGLDGEDGADTITNAGAIASVATVAGASTNTSVTLVGASKGDASANSTAVSWIIEGGAGDDIIRNDGVGVSTATSVGVSQSVEVTVAGALLGKADSLTTASANGIGGGADDDIIVNAAKLDLNGTASGRVGRTSVAVAGSDGGASVATDILASAVGVSGGTGEDAIENTALIDIDLSSTTTANSTSVVVAGASQINAGLFATSNGVGLNGDEDDDTLINNVGGDIDIVSVASISASGGSVNIAGVSAANGLARSRAKATGMAGGDGDDDLFNFGRINIQATGSATSSQTSFTVAGSATSGGDLKGTTSAYGMSGGAGNDYFENTGTLSVRTDARSTLGGGSYAFAGYAGSGGAAGADAFTTAVFGDAGRDEFLIGGVVTSIADARSTANSNVNVTFGASNSSRSPLGVGAFAKGVDGGDDDDLITILGAVNTYSYAGLTTTNTKYVFGGGTSGANSARARSESFAVLGGSGADVITNYGAILASAEARTAGSGAAGAFIGATSSASEVVAQSTARGLFGGAGVDVLNNFGSITLELTNSTRSQNTVSSTFLFSSGIATSKSTNIGAGALFYDTQSDTTVVNDGAAKLTYFGDRGGLRGAARSEATSNGVTVGVGINARAESLAFSNVQLWGVQLGAGNQTVVNNGNLEIESFAFSSAAATANGNSAINGHGTAIARAYVNSNTLTGVESLSGALDFVNTGLLRVLNKPKAATAALPNATGIGVTDPDARATATIEMNNVHAYGVRSGDAADRIENSGVISVRSQPEADRALARATPGGPVSLSVDSFADSAATVNDAEAYGIHAGNGDNIILNSGDIIVVSDPYAEARSEATGRGPDGDVWARATANALRAQAYGVITGAGDDYIENTGLISVAATPGRSATTSVSPGSFCITEIAGVCIGLGKGEIDRNETGGTTSRTILAISTGGGNDTVVNGGTISAANGTAISLGDGDDTLMLMPGSVITGSVSAGAGSDTLHFTGAMNYNALGQSFENFTKTGLGVASLTNASLLSSNILAARTIVEGGTLSFNGRVQMTAASQVTTYIYGSGALGQLSSTSTMALDGALSVAADDGVYIDGRTYDVVRGSTRTGAFDAVMLPAPTALRFFTGGYTSNAYRVTANVAAISSMMSSSSPTEVSFAAALDGATLIAEGSVAETIAALQSLPEQNQVRGAVASLTPELSTGSIRTAGDTLAASEAAAGQRLASFRAGRTGRAAQPAFGFALVEGRKTTKGATAWAARYDGANVVPTISGRLTGDLYGTARGVDLETKTGALLGFSMTQLQSDGALGGVSNGAAFRSNTMTLYGAAPLGAKGYATASLSWGETDVAGMEALLGADAAGLTGFDKKNSALGVSLEAGRAFRAAPGAPEVFAALNYREVTGDAFAQNRIAGLDVTVDEGQSRQLDSELGVRLAGEMKLAGAEIRPHLTLSWVRRHGEGESVIARFTDMPDYAFRLRGDLDNRDALRAKAGVSLLSDGAFELTASGAGEIGDVKSDLTAEVRGVVKF